MEAPNNRDGMQGSPPTPLLAAEIAKFDALAAQWWDPAGPMRPLHAMNPLRVGWITRRIPPSANILDVGCGAGLASEALASAGHTVLGIDAAPAVLAAARAHATQTGVAVSYREALTSDLVAEGLKFDAITALEVIEHVVDPAGFLRDLAALVIPGGTVFISTLNRTTRSLVVAKWGAEYILRLLPPGTHSWRRFITPAELARMARGAGLRMTDSAGLSYEPIRGRWDESRDLSVNYVVSFKH